MLTYIHLFTKNFARSPPPANFFQDLQSYQQFCMWTVALASKIPMLSHVQPDMVQSYPTDHPSNTSWFLDNVSNPYLTPENRNQARSVRNRGIRRGNYPNNNQRCSRRNRR